MYGRIGNYTFIGVNVMIMPGVTIGNDCIIGAGTVVTKSVPDNTIIGGNSMRVIGKTDEYMKMSQGISAETFGLSPKEKKRVLLSMDDNKFLRKSYIKTDE